MAAISLSETWDLFRTAVHPEWAYKNAIDNIGQTSDFMLMLREKGMVLSGGADVRFPVTRSLIGNVKWLGNISDDVSLQKPDNKTMARYAWKDVTCPVVFDDNDLSLNSSKNSLFNLVTERYKDAEQAMHENMATTLYSSTGTGTGKPMGLVALVDTTKSAYTIGGFDTSTETWFHNQSSSCASFATYGMDQLRAMSDLVNVGVKGSTVGSPIPGNLALPGRTSIILSSPTNRQYYEEQALSLGDLKIDQKLADIGMYAVSWKGKPWITDQKATPTDSIWFIDFDALKLVLHKEKWMYATSLERVPTNLDMAAIIHTKLTPIVTERRKLGVIHTVTA